MERIATEVFDSVIPLPGSDVLASNALATNAVATDYSNGTETEDRFIIRNGEAFASTQIIIDLWQPTRLDYLAHMEAAMR